MLRENKKQRSNLPAPTSNGFAKNYRSSNIWFTLTLIFMAIDLCQIQTMIRPLAVVRPGLLVTITLLYYVFTNWSLVREYWSKQLTYTVCFVLLLLALTCIASNTYRAFMTGRSMLLMLPFLLSLNVVCRTPGRILTALKTLEWILFVLAIYSLSHGGRGPGGMMSDENDLTLFIVTVLPLSFYLYGQAQGVKGKAFHLAVMGCSLLAVVAAFSRGGFIGLLGMLFVYWLLSKRKIVSLLAIGIMFGVLYFAGGDAYYDEMKTVTDTEDSTANERLLSWQAGWDMFLDNPLGVGGSNYPVRFPEYQPEEMRRNMWGRVAHSLWFTLIPETGVLGILLFVAILVRNCRDILMLLKDPSGNSEMGKAYAAGLVGFLASATFISVLYYTTFWMMSVLISVTVACTHKVEGR